MASFPVPARVCFTIAFLAFTATMATAQQRTDFGTLSIQVRPPDAEIFIDGERWAALAQWVGANVRGLGYFGHEVPP